MALWLVALLLCTLLPPVASAAHNTGHRIQFTQADLLVKNNAGQYVPVGTTLLVPGSEVAIDYALTVPDCEAVNIAGPPAPQLENQRPTSLTITFALIDKLAAANTNFIHTTVPATITARQTFTVAGNLTNGLETLAPTASIGMTAVAICPTPPQGSLNSYSKPTDGATTTGLFAADTKPPQLPAHTSTVQLTHDAQRVASTSTAVAIGTTFALQPLWTDASGLQLLELDFTELGGAKLSVPTASPAPARSITVADSATSGKAYNGVNAPYWINATDAAGNRVSQQFTVLVDNVRPQPAGFAAVASTIERTTTGATLSTGWTATTPGDTNRAQVTLAHGRTSVTPAVFDGTAALGHPTSTQTFTLPLVDPLRSWVNVSLLPVDTAGNLGPSTMRRDVVFPQNMTVQYGGQPDTPALVSGRGIRNVYVNMSEGGAVPTTGNPPAIYGELVRQGPSALLYWKNGTSGNNPATDANGHYTATPQRDAGAASPTVFQPTGTVANVYVVTNLSDITGQARNFYDGQYQLRINVSSPQGHRVQVTHGFDIDSRAPDVRPHRNYTNPNLGAGPNMTQLHGMDGNPIRVVFNVTDHRTEESTLLDSGLRNITVELYDPLTGQVATRTRTNTPARVELTPASASSILPYVYDFRTAPDPATCVGANHWTAACVWQNITRTSPQQNWTATFVNNTMFSGWVNLTMDDLAPGKYAVRVLAYDKASLVDPKAYLTTGDGYRVAPAVKLAAPRVTDDGRLDVVGLASQRLANPPAQLAAKCIDAHASPAVRQDTCPADRVRIYVSATNGAADVGTLYEERALATGATQKIDERGWTNSYVPYSYAPSLSNGTLAFGTNPITYFEYVSNAPPLLSQVAPSINPAQSVYVRAVAVALDPAGNEIITSTTDWVRAASAAEPSLMIRQPAACELPCLSPDWPLNLSGDMPRFNVSFDRKADAPPRMMYWVNTTAGTTILFNHTNASPLRAGNQEPRFVYNWSGTLVGSGSVGASTTGPTLPAGEYELRVLVVDGSEKLAPEQSRFFTILPAKPTLVFDTSEDRPGIVETGTKRVVGSTFEVAFEVDHSFANLTGAHQIAFKLIRGTVRTGQSASLDAGQEGFNVVLRPQTALDESETRSRFLATLTMPTGAVDGDSFQLNATALLDVYPFKMGNSSGFLDVVFDKQVPVGTLLTADSQDTVADFSSGGGNQPRKNDANPAPAFMGFAEDRGAGVKKVEVRLVDLTRNVTLTLTADNALVANGIEANTWNAGTACATGIVRVCPRATGGIWDWSIPLVNRGAGTTDLWVSSEPTTGAYRFNLSHTYRVDVRVTDRLDQVSTVNSTTFTFDPFAPDIAYAGFLRAESQGLPSGIEITPAGRTQVNWRGEGTGVTFTVKASDNHCLGEVRLWGRSDKNPTVNVSAPMRPVSHSGRICPNGATTTWALDLAAAPHMAEDVSNYTYWFSATDMAGRTTTVPQNYQTLRLQVLDYSPARVDNAFPEPSKGQAGGRAIVRAQVFDNLAVSHVNVTFHDLDDPFIVYGSGQMRREDTTDAGVGIWVLDTTEDIPNLTLEVRDYLVNVTAYDVNWNRTVDPTCPFICLPYQFIYQVRDDGAPSVILESPAANATVNATPTIRVLAQHKTLDNASISVRASSEPGGANLTEVPRANLSFVERLATNGTRQGWSVQFRPTTPLADNTTLHLNVTATVAGLTVSQAWSFRVDAVGPTVTASVNGTRDVANVTYATPNTRITLVANDTVALSPTILYRVNNGAQQTYGGPLTPAGADGNWSLEYWAVDGAGNAAEPQRLSLVLDATPPRITVAKHGDELLLTVADVGSGLNESSVTVHYRYGDAVAYATANAVKVAGNSFSATLPGDASATGLRYYFSAADNLGQVGTEYSAAQPYLIARENATPANLPPTIRVTQPAEGATVRGSLDLRWLAEDPEGAPLSISIALRDPAPGRVLSAGGENSGSFPVNVSGFTPGTYTVVVTATDGENSVSAQVSFAVEAAEVVRLSRGPAAQVAVNTEVPLAVTIQPEGKTVAQATYRVLREGVVSQQGPLTLTGGVYGAAFTPTESGRYAVFIDVTYADGTSEPPKQVASFTVPGTSEPPVEEARAVLPPSLMVLVAVALLTVALAAYGAFGRWRK